MNSDISKILRSWEYKPNTLIVREITGDDGREKIQIRVDLGILQMEVEGRPDSTFPHNMESMLAHYESLIKEYKDYYDTTEGFTLTDQDMKDLDAEIMQYYNRRACFFILKDYARAKLDSEHNLRIMDVIKKYCNDKDYIESHEQFRPFVIMERSRAAGLESINKGDYASAMEYISEAMEMIERFYVERGASDDEIRRNRELILLRKWRSQIHQDWEGGVIELDEDSQLC